MTQPEQRVEELKPCPFCGDQPKRNGRGVTGGVLCAGAGAHPHMAHRVQTYGATQAEADAAWNRRPTPPAAQPEGELSDLIEMLRSAEYSPDFTLSYDHTPEEIGLAVTDNHDAVLSALLAATPSARISSDKDRENPVEGRGDGISEAREAAAEWAATSLSLTQPATPEPAGEDWLLRQLNAWPARIDREKTINVEYLMKASAKRIDTLQRTSTISTPRPERTDALREAVQFLLERLTDHEASMTSDEDAREWHGHVAPAIARVASALDTGSGEG